MSEKQTKTDKTRKRKKRMKADLMEEANRKEALTFEDLRKVLDACETIEEEAMVKLAITTGIRREDFARIELMNVHLEDRYITFWEEKKDRPWKVPLEPNIVQVLKKYIPTLPTILLRINCTGFRTPISTHVNTIGECSSFSANGGENYAHS